MRLVGLPLVGKRPVRLRLVGMLLVTVLLFGWWLVRTWLFRVRQPGGHQPARRDEPWPGAAHGEDEILRPELQQHPSRDGRASDKLRRESRRRREPARRPESRRRREPARSPESR
jgi:hypothetical protein